jgi:adenosylhomocysteine nucleosidase
MSIFEAIVAGDAERARNLVAADPLQAVARDQQGVSALMLARYRSQTEIVQALLDAAPELDVFEAAALGIVERLEQLIDEDPSKAKARSADDTTALHFAAFFNQPACSRLLLEHGADVHAVSPTFGNVTPLHSAAAADSLEIVRLLVEHGADVNARQNGNFTALDAAVQNENEELQAYLLEHGAERGVSPA